MSETPVTSIVPELNVAVATAIGRPRTVLDVQCGRGMHGATAKRVGAHVVAIEARRDQVETARRMLDEVIEVDPRDFDKLAERLGNRKFDVILMADLLHTADDVLELLRFYRSYLDEGGRLVASFRNQGSWTRKLHLKATSALLNGTAGGERPLLQRDAEQAMKEAGFQVLYTEHNPMLLKASRTYVDGIYALAAQGEKGGLRAAFLELPVYEAYRATVRPVEEVLCKVAPSLLSAEHVVVGRVPTKPGPLSLTVGMLTMDEEQSIEPMIGEIRAVAPDAKILIVDSSLKDQTPYIAERLGARVIRQLPPRGHGPAMEVLMYAAAKQSDALIYLDCDFTYPPNVIPTIRKILESGADVVNASRTRRRPEAMPLANFLANRSFALTARVMHGIPTTDLHSGMRGYRSSLIRSFAFDGEGDAIPIDTLLWPTKCGYNVVEIPIEYQERVGFSKLRKMAGTIWTFIRLAKTLRVGTRRPDSYDVRDADS
jgi:SAM-dependent methyltransferase